MATVLKHMKWAADGFTIEYLAPGDVRDFGAATLGLAAEGFVDDTVVETEPAEPVTPVIETPTEPVVEAPSDVVEPAAEPVATVSEPVVEPDIETIVAPAVEPEVEQPRRRKSR